MERSRAYGRLTARFGEVRVLLELCSSPETEPSARRAAAGKDGALLRGALVLLCSHLEGFFEDLIEETLRVFNFEAPNIPAIPLTIRQRQVTSRLRMAEHIDVEREWHGLLNCMTHPLLRDDDPSMPGNRMIDPDLHTRGFANPGTGEIEKLMASVGVVDCWTVVNAALGHKLGADTVNAVVNRRNQIAHGNLESSVSRLDAEDYVSVLETVCSQFDIVAGEHLAACTGNPDPWASG